MATVAARLTQSVTSKCHELLVPSKAKHVSIKYQPPHIYIYIYIYLNVTVDRLQNSHANQLQCSTTASMRNQIEAQTVVVRLCG